MNLPTLYANQKELVNRAVNVSATVLALADIAKSTGRISEEQFAEMCRKHMEDMLSRAEQGREEAVAQRREMQEEAKRRILAKRAEQAGAQFSVPDPEPVETTETVEVGAEDLNSVVTPEEARQV